MPTRNAVAYIGRALASVLSQEPPPADVVVVDAGSTDGTCEVVAATAGVRLVEQSGVGLGAARNQGVEAVAGELVAFCDADDRWAPGALVVRMRHVLADPACDAVIGSVVMEPIDGSDTPQAQIGRLGEPLPGFTPGALMARRRTLERVGPFSEHLTIGTDSEWFVRLVQSGLRCDRLDQVVLHKGARAGSLSTDVTAYRRELLTVARSYVAHRRRRDRSGG
ncbi:MAG: glycosyltransferase family 2 protein [Acidimicrobiia bacterium]|nr:glycosyltransferase family 2 protein [Acidimicrobiia bacterium]